ncbi:MAG: TetR/AcrR family transcriptional regulator [Emcibacter sp.]|nr:TetR/AcrR family transcriptional regulator [Emcibacter sp.]
MAPITVKSTEEVYKKTSRRSKRRKDILWALHNCMIEKGYAQTTLADIAIAAGMSSSHLLYYFNGKEAILQQYFQSVALQIIDRLNEIRIEEPRIQIDLLASLFFAGSGITKLVIGLMLECFGAAVHDKILQQEKSDLDAKCKSYLRDLMSHTPGGFLKDINTAAEVAYATLIGLRTAVYFDPNFDLEEAHNMFHMTMLKMTGLEPEN